MFHSFFPRPKLFFSSFVVWALACVILWFVTATGWGSSLSLGGLIGAQYPAALGEGADEAALAAFGEAQDWAQNFWFWQYQIACYVIFCVFWLWLSPQKWGRWSVAGSALIVFSTWFQVQMDVLINNWFGDFYNLIQKALAEPGSVTIEEYYSTLFTFLKIAMPAVIVWIFSSFFVSHYIFRWRNAMNDHYMAMWQRIRHIEGASQRVQEDTMRFAAIVEALGVHIIDAAMTLIAFLPILWVLSESVKEVPILGAIPYSLVWIAIIWSVFGTALVALAGIRLPGLEFRNQRVEAAYRKELVLGEEYEDRAEPPTVAELFANVRKNYFRLYFNYLYFNFFRRSYSQIGVLVPYIALGPTIVGAVITLGVMQQIVRAFGRVESSFQFLISSWTTIVELMSIYKRLAAFEATIRGEELAEIELEMKSVE